jgi:hypothetical protein
MVRSIELRRRRTEAVFERARLVATLDRGAELEADYARHLCILLSGFVEKGVAELVLAYADGKSARPVLAYLEANLRRLTNVDKERLLTVVGQLDFRWRTEIDGFVIDERREALNSIIGLRNDIAHGGGGSISLGQVSQYWVHIQAVVDYLESMLLPPARPASQRR